MSASFNPKFLYKNYVTDTSQISTTGTGIADTTANKLKLFDRNEEVQWTSIGSTSGTRTIVWTPTSATAITRIFLQNINWSTFTIKYNTSSNFSTTISFSGNTETNLYFEFNSVSVSNVTISVTATMTAGEAIKCGQLYIGAEIFEIASTTGGKYGPPVVNTSVSQKNLTLSDGTTYKNYIRSVRNYSLQMCCASASERTNFKNLFNTNKTSTFVFIPRASTTPDSWDGLAGHYVWINPPDFENWTDFVLINGYDINVELYQAGGLG